MPAGTEIGILSRIFTLLTRRRIIYRAAIISAIVGTILIGINQGNIIASGQFPPLWKIILTYMVPYSVSSYSSVASAMEQSDGQNGEVDLEKITVCERPT